MPAPAELSLKLRRGEPWQVNFLRAMAFAGEYGVPVRREEGHFVFREPEHPTPNERAEAEAVFEQMRAPEADVLAKRARASINLIACALAWRHGRVDEKWAPDAFDEPTSAMRKYNVANVNDPGQLTRCIHQLEALEEWRASVESPVGEGEMRMYSVYDDAMFRYLTRSSLARYRKDEAAVASACDTQPLDSTRMAPQDELAAGVSIKKQKVADRQAECARLEEEERQARAAAKEEAAAAQRKDRQRVAEMARIASDQVAAEAYVATRCSGGKCVCCPAHFREAVQHFLTNLSPFYSTLLLNGYNIITTYTFRLQHKRLIHTVKLPNPNSGLLGGKARG